MCSTTTIQEYKGYKKILQENVFHRSIDKIYVTLMKLSRHIVALELSYRLKELGMKQESLFYFHTGRDRSKWFIGFALFDCLVDVILRDRGADDRMDLCGQFL